MLPLVFKEEPLFAASQNYLPSVSIFVPFEPRVMPKWQIEQSLKAALDKVKEEMHNHFPRYVVKPAFNKLKAIISKLEYSTLKKSIAIFLSPFEEKIYYLNIPLKEKVVVNKAVEFRELIAHKKEERKYLILEVSDKSSRIFLGEASKLTRLVSNLPQQMEGKEIEKSSDSSITFNGKRNSFFRHVDDALSIVLKAYPLPLFIMGSEKNIADFVKASRNGKQIAEYIYGHFSDITIHQIQTAVQPYLEEWKKTKQKDLLLQANNALLAGKLTVGISDVWKAASSKKAKLLLVERDFTYPAYFGEGADIIYADTLNDNHHSYFIKDAVEDTIEKVLADGGDVEFTEPGLLKDFMHIAFIQNY